MFFANPFICFILLNSLQNIQYDDTLENICFVANKLIIQFSLLISHKKKYWPNKMMK